MKEAVEKLLKKMGEDKEFAENILKQREIEKVIELAGAEGIDLTPEDIDEANEIIRKALELQSNAEEGELSEEELENVAGGTSSALLSAAIVLSIMSALSAAASAMSGVVVTISVSYSLSVNGTLDTLNTTKDEK